MILSFLNIRLNSCYFIYLCILPFMYFYYCLKVYCLNQPGFLAWL
jgi:hypothetical protein